MSFCVPTHFLVSSITARYSTVWWSSICPSTEETVIFLARLCWVPTIMIALPACLEGSFSTTFVVGEFSQGPHTAITMARCPWISLASRSFYNLSTPKNPKQVTAALSCLIKWNIIKNYCIPLGRKAVQSHNMDEVSCSWLVLWLIQYFMLFLSFQLKPDTDVLKKQWIYLIIPLIISSFLLKAVFGKQNVSPTTGCLPAGFHLCPFWIRSHLSMWSICS